ncbi:ankyrin-1-like [Trichogramma pretiosum]|uniref:ankyrin-1-like n=1 Tax=Trichogramma pretiosum TaxID=7493 RepID=UPI0006C97627|nr:ankyrin-1-like [Trichogramma pretiosum]
MSTFDGLKKLKKLRKKVNWKIEEERHEFILRLESLFSDCTGQLPNIQDILQPKKIDCLLSDSLTSRRGYSFIKLVARSGYKDDFVVRYEDGEPLLRRTTPLHRAARCRYLIEHDVVSDLFKIYNRSDVNYADEFGLTHLHVACMFYCGDVIKNFLDYGQFPNCIEQETGDSPLHLVLKDKNRDMVELLLKSGADPNLVNKNGSNALHTICQGDSYDDTALMTMIFELGGSECHPVQVDAQDNSGNTPLNLALLHGKKNLAILLLKKGANTTLTNQEGLNSLHIVCRKYCSADLVAKLYRHSDKKYRPVRISTKNKKARKKKLLK